MNKQPGFSVIELVISIMLSALLMTAALTIYDQISKATGKIKKITQNDITIIVAKQRLSQDFTGLSTLWFTKDMYANLAEQKQKNTKKDAKNSVPTAEVHPNIMKNNYLCSQNNQNQFDYATFITTSTLQTYTNPQYRCTRVVYILKKDPDTPNLFLLQRKEDQNVSNEFNLETLRQGNFYTLARNIIDCHFEFGFIDPSPQERKQKPEEAWKLKWVDHWSASQDMKQVHEYRPTLPEIVRIKMTLQEDSTQQPTQEEFCCLIQQSKDATCISFAQKRYEQEMAKNRDGVPA